MVCPLALPLPNPICNFMISVFTIMPETDTLQLPVKSPPNKIPFRPSVDSFAVQARLAHISRSLSRALGSTLSVVLKTRWERSVESYIKHLVCLLPGVLKKLGTLSWKVKGRVHPLLPPTAKCFLAWACHWFYENPIVLDLLTQNLLPFLKVNIWCTETGLNSGSTHILPAPKQWAFRFSGYILCQGLLF